MWEGRLDGTEIENLRLWQKIKIYNEEKNSIVFTGYNTDEGVGRNLGRLGSSRGPNTIRKMCSSLPYIESFGELFDTGNIDIFNLELAQKELAHRTEKVIKSNSFPINLGGGHDIAYGTYLGIRAAYPGKKIGIINFDAHLDMRCYSKYPTSGTMFKQILDTDPNSKYLIVGYQEMGNTLKLRNTAYEKGVVICDIELEKDDILDKLRVFLKNCDVIYTTFCMDVFDITEAPGVSAPTSVGLDKKMALEIFTEIIKSKKLTALDFAEVNPDFDIDNRTSRLASNFIYKVLKNKSEILKYEEA